MSTFGFVKKVNKDNHPSSAFSRDLSILDFNRRVMTLAADPHTPAVERLRFINIVYKNMLEFISVRLHGVNASDFVLAINTIESIYKDLKDLYDEITATCQFEVDDNFVVNSHCEYINKNFQDGQNYLVVMLNDWKFDIYSMYMGIEDFKKLIDMKYYQKDEVKFYFVVNFISDRSFDYIYTGEGIDETLEELEIMNSLKTNASFHYMQTTCDNALFIGKLLDYLEVQVDKVIHVPYEIIRIGDRVKYIENTYQDPAYYYPKLESQYQKIEDFDEVLNSRAIHVRTPEVSYQIILDFIEDMCTRPDIDTIMITLYRLAKDSKIIQSLEKAAKLNKSVYVYIEPLARGDEEPNLIYIKELRKYPNVFIRCNYLGYKIHSKMMLAINTKDCKYYTNIGTGNYNEDTAKLYTDTYVIVNDRNVGFEVLEKFQHIFYKTPMVENPEMKDQQSIFMSPTYLRKHIMECINAEMKKGQYGFIMMKCNSLCDRGIINKLYSAASKGVKIKLLVRSALTITPSANLQIKSHVGRFLEHDRIYIFGTDVYISSADILTRNLDKRVECMYHASYDLSYKIILNMVSLWKDHTNFTLDPDTLNWD